MIQILSQLVRQQIGLRTVEHGPLEASQPLDSWTRAGQRAATTGWALRGPVLKRLLSCLRRVLGRVHVFRRVWHVLRRSPQRKVARHVRPLLRQLLQAGLPGQAVDARHLRLQVVLASTMLCLRGGLLLRIRRA